MNTNERNEWLERNLGIIEGTTRRFCDRYPECTYDEMYSDIILWLITKLDGKYGDELADISKTKLNQMVCNRLNNYRKSAPSKEDPVDPSHFELVYEPDFYKNIIPWECEKYVSLTEIEKEIFFAYTFDDAVLLKDFADQYGFTVERIRQIQKKACDKVLYQLLLKNHSKALYFKFEGVARVKINREFYPIFVSAIIKSDKTSFVRASTARVKIQHKIVDKLNIYYQDVYVDQVELKNAFISDNVNLESVDLRYDSSIEEIEHLNKEIIDALRCEYVLKIKGTTIDEFGESSETLVAVRKKKYLKEDSRLSAIKQIINSAPTEALLVAEANNLSNIQILSPIRTHDVEITQVRLKYT